MGDALEPWEVRVASSAPKAMAANLPTRDSSGFLHGHSRFYPSGDTKASVRLAGMVEPAGLASCGVLQLALV